MDKKTTIGGQALLEGILMRGPSRSAIVVRKPDGELAVKIDEVGSASKLKIGRLPLVRGVVNFFNSMRYGMNAITYSASFAEEDTAEPEGRIENWLNEKLGNEKVEKALMGLAVVFGIAIPIVLFFMLPTLIAGLFGEGLPNIVRNLVEGLVRIIIFVLFIYVTSKQKDMRRTYMYHGAEHKTIACYEAGEELTVDNVRRHSRFHPRCGTSFLFVVMIISILFTSLFTWKDPLVRVLIRLALLPLIVAVSYEVNRFAGRHDNRFTMLLRAPGLLMQRLTTNEPDDSMIEVGIESLRLVIPENEDEDRW
ncbi:MAG: DUF1385 domain-containing protein [Clostridia bacterium]|nr:DUF1385 domain-containing protein [Clostridia bacterium]